MPDPKAEYKLFYAILVAGKSARFADEKMRQLRGMLNVSGEQWLAAVKQAHRESRLWVVIRGATVGNYRKNHAAFAALALKSSDWVRTATIDELEGIPGIGRKTSRFFLRWSGSRERFAVLDVHILRWMAEQGVEDVPRATPGGAREYARLEREFLRLADEQGIHPADLDEKLWLERNKSGIRS